MKKTCSVKNCDEAVRSRGFCNRHYAQVWRYGKVLPRSRNDPNGYKTSGAVTHIETYHTDHTVMAVIKIDTEDLARVIKYRITYSTFNSAAIANKQCLGRLILKAREGQVVGFVSKDRKDYRKSNLLITQNRKFVNRRGKKLNKNNPSGIKGVVWTSWGNREGWVARLEKNRKIYIEGPFDSIKVAAKIRKQMELEHWGE